MAAQSRYPEQITCRIPKEDREYIESQSDPSEWIRQAIKEKREREKEEEE